MASRGLFGLGSARASGTFRRQRLLSIALLPLTIYVVMVGMYLAGADHEAVAATLHRPVVWIPLLAFVALCVWHMKLGMQEAIDDYVRRRHAPATAINVAFCVAVGLAAGYGILRLGLSG